MKASIEKIIGIVKEAVGHDKIKHDTDMETVGLDSLGCLDLVARVEDAYHIEITCMDRIELRTPDCLVAIVNRALGLRLVEMAA